MVVSTTGIGDTLWGTPAIKALRETFPDAYICVLTNPAGFEVLKGNPDIDDILIFIQGSFGYLSCIGLLTQLRKKNIATAFIFHSSDRIIWPLCFFSGAVNIIGIEGQSKGLDFILTKTIKLQDNIHGIETRLRLVKQVGAKNASRTISIYLADREREAAVRFMESNGIKKENSSIIGFQPGAQKPFKCWPQENFIEAGNILVKSLGCKIIVTGDSSERELVDEIASGIKGAVPAAGKLSIRETAAIIEKMNLFITNDTGPMHIAFALKTPTIALFSPTDPRLCGPHHADRVAIISKPITCNPCTGKKCLNPVCMEQIEVKEVVESAKVMLRRYNAHMAMRQI
ncbi:MAG: glycosyltransferase family 9 protein [Nitrospirota bacterium]